MMANSAARCWIQSFCLDILSFYLSFHLLPLLCLSIQLFVCHSGLLCVTIVIDVIVLSVMPSIASFLSVIPTVFSVKQIDVLLSKIPMSNFLEGIFYFAILPDIT